MTTWHRSGRRSKSFSGGSERKSLGSAGASRAVFGALAGAWHRIFLQAGIGFWEKWNEDEAFCDYVEMPFLIPGTWIQMLSLISRLSNKLRPFEPTQDTVPTFLYIFGYQDPLANTLYDKEGKLPQPAFTATPPAGLRPRPSR